MAGNCGNLSSMVAYLAFDEGICSARVENGRIRVRSWNTNTKNQIDTVFPIATDTQGGSVRPLLDREGTEMAGVPGKPPESTWSSQILLGREQGAFYLPVGRLTFSICL